MTATTEPKIFAVAPVCTMQELLIEVDRLVAVCPAILQGINADLDANAVVKKRERQATAEWKRKKQFGAVAKALEPEVAITTVTKLAINGGRPRTPAIVVLAGLFIRGRYGSLTAASVRDQLVDSAAFDVFLWRQGLEEVDATVLARHVNNLSDALIERIFSTQLGCFKREGLDDFALFSADSTSVRANAQWPNDSSLIYKLLRRAVSTLTAFTAKNLCHLPMGLVEKWLEELRVVAREIDLSSGKPNSAIERKKQYRVLVDLARKLAVKLGTHWDGVSIAVESADLRPIDVRLRDAAINDFVRSVSAALHLIDFAEVRTQEDPDVKREEHEKISGVIEKDASIIIKGGRTPNFGFKIQAAFSAKGVVTALIIDKGNVSDSESLLHLLAAATKRTGVAPTIGTVDDGYSSKENWQVAIEKHGMEVMSISGAKGRAVIGDERYDSEPYRQARRIRGKLEFPFFVLKHVQEMDRMKRTGLASVRREITEKALAYNAIRLIQLRKQRKLAHSKLGKQILAA